MTAHAANASTTETSGASTNTPLLALAGMIGSLRMNLKKSANGWRTPHGPTTFGPAPQLHRAPDLSLNVDQRRRREQQAHEQQQALEHVPKHRADVALVHPVRRTPDIAAALIRSQNAATITMTIDRGDADYRPQGGEDDGLLGDGGCSCESPIPPPGAERPAREPNIRP